MFQDCFNFEARKNVPKINPFNKVSISFNPSYVLENFDKNYSISGIISNTDLKNIPARDTHRSSEGQKPNSQKFKWSSDGKYVQTNKQKKEYI